MHIPSMSDSPDQETRTRILRRTHEEKFGPGPLRLARAPGRVNLIGEHTDYHGGFVLPLALACDTWIAFRRAPGRTACFHSVDFEESVAFPLEENPSACRGHWSRYVHGMAAVLRETGLGLQGIEAVIQGNVPMGAGLSSSASLLVAAGLAYLDAAALHLEPRALIAAARETEHVHAGLKSGIMDFAVAVHGRGGPLLIDCHDGSVRQVRRVPPGTVLMVVQSGVKHDLASSAYNQRVEECRTALEGMNRALSLDLASLREVDRDLVRRARGALDPVGYRRLHHVVEENHRVLEAVNALEAGDARLLGDLMRASHESLRDEYEVSCAEIDTLVSLAHTVEGVFGSRITGGGFGGATVTLVRKDAVPRFRKILLEGYEKAHGRTADFMEAVPGEGATVRDL